MAAILNIDFCLVDSGEIKVKIDSRVSVSYTNIELEF